VVSIAGYSVYVNDIIVVVSVDGDMLLCLPSIKHPLIEMVRYGCQPFMETVCLNILHLWKRYEVKSAVTDQVR
jgi:hypothetical protein